MPAATITPTKTIAAEPLTLKPTSATPVIKESSIDGRASEGPGVRRGGVVESAHSSSAERGTCWWATGLQTSRRTRRLLLACRTKSGSRFQPPKRRGISGRWRGRGFINRNESARGFSKIFKYSTSHGTSVSEHYRVINYYLNIVHDDLCVLTGYHTIRFERVGRAKRPFMLYELVEVSSIPRHFLQTMTQHLSELIRLLFIFNMLF
jgi:hypothetical protein